MAKQGAGKRDEAGAERIEPGQSTRTVNPDASGSIADIARQQGASQRGYTADNPHQYDEPAPPGAKITGDPGRAMGGPRKGGNA
ncbi:hypothetical protein [Polyangium jinanense]|uniref:Uncharacterized protein n=1 Tax=Polyangium jinanense TaxID=2829994 RepID=A0A9X4AWK7_9BACT|nr:hypothetical protein [Polyangium jinanense]MDC3960570.1 hypothetical protein [Polyangium jinanense]MDC3985432.1 hypothetical protein [Polyangium jinanense]